MNVGDVPAREFALRLRGPGVRLGTGPFVVRLRTRLPELADLVQFLYSDFPLDDEEGLVDFDVSVQTPPGLRRWWRPQAVFSLDDRVPFRPFPRAAALPLLEWGLNWCVSTRGGRFLIIHAAVVERDGRAAIMAAPPGSGKSTLTAALVHRGWRLLSDEFALVRPRDLRLTPLPRPISLKERSIEVIRAFAPEARLGPVAMDTHKGMVALVRPPAASVARAADTAPASWVIFPAYAQGTRARLETMSKARALIRLADNSFNYNVLGLGGFDALGGLIDSCEGYEFRYGDLDDAIECFDSLAAVAVGRR